jgi:hypothetical protein
MPSWYGQMRSPSTAVQKPSFAYAMVNSQPMNHMVPMPASTLILSEPAIEATPYRTSVLGLHEAAVSAHL